MLFVLAVLAGACSGNRGVDPGAAAPTPASAAPTVPATSFGSLPSTCGPGDASGATQQGVTDGTITIGYGDDAGFSGSPGLNREQSAAVREIIDWCNRQGGINGRQVVGRYYDAKVTEVTNVMAAACSEVFMLVGEGFALDGGQEQARLNCGLAAVPAWTSSTAFAHGALMVQPIPNPVDVTSIQNAYALARAFPDAVTRAGVLTSNYPITKDTTDKAKLSYPSAGWRFLDCEVDYAITGEADWKPLVQRLKDCGARAVYFAGTPNPTLQNVLDAAAQLEYRPIWVTDTNMYDASFAAWNTNGYADDVYIRMTWTPFEQAASNPATQQFLQLMKDADARPTLLAGQAVSAFLLWATAARECGSDLTSTCVLERLRAVHEWSGGGLHAATDPGANLASDCGLVVRLDRTRFVQAFPEQEGTFDCRPEYNVAIQGPVVDQAKLDDQRISHQAG